MREEEGETRQRLHRLHAQAWACTAFKVRTATRVIMGWYEATLINNGPVRGDAV